MKRWMTVLLTATVLTVATFLVTLPAQIGEAHVPILPAASTAELVQLPSSQAESPTSQPSSPDSNTDAVAWLAAVVIALPVLAVLLALLISTMRRHRTHRPVKRPGQSY